jgi:SHS2 domain-containing protein
MYRQLEHPADLYFEVIGKDLNEIFTDSASAILEYIGIVNSVSSLEEEAFEFDGSIDDILIEFLNEVLFEAVVRDKYLTNVNISIDKDWKDNSQLKANIYAYFKKVKEIKREIKAISYHMAELKPFDGKLVFRFIADV